MKGKRSAARETALKVLYQLDITRDDAKEGLKIFFRHHRVPVSSQPFVSRLVEGTAAHQKEIDALLARHATNWALDRMAIVDRNILRLGVYELLFDHQETPPKAVINEAVDLAKRFGTVDSGKFVNGVLDSIHKSQTPSVPPASESAPIHPAHDAPAD